MRSALLVCVLAILSGWTRPQPQSGSAAREVRVLTFNIHHGASRTSPAATPGGVDDRIDLDKVAAVITGAKADIVGLQEVDRGVERSGRRDLLKELADLTGLAYAFGKNLDHQGGDYGNALLTRFPILSEGNRPLPAPNAGEPRGVLQVVLDIHGTKTLVLVTHLDHRAADEARVASADAMAEMLAPWGQGPVIAMGDFNDVPGSRTHAKLSGLLTDVWPVAGKGDGFTIPIAAPNRRIDWILVRGLTPLHAEVIATDASDHLPVAATLGMP